MTKPNELEYAMGPLDEVIKLAAKDKLGSVFIEFVEEGQEMKICMKGEADLTLFSTHAGTIVAAVVKK